jgi:hypothetical protein
VDSFEEVSVMSVRTMFVGFVVIALVATGCGDDDDDGALAQLEYCDAGQSLESSVVALSGLFGVEDLDLGKVMDFVVEGSDEFESAIEAVENDLGALKEAATDVAADDVDALDQAMDDVDDALSELGSDLSTENATAVQDAVQRVGTAAQAVYDTLTDCS